ncbi:LCP family protein [Nesterenkonia halobia]|uniref:Cell envelope-related transcriptional attenuator domain-containing protein n=1 Tax=Nesterenkonia halobia TaxID=37922 RepID=A0ABP6RCH9_9MICC
MAGSSVSYHRFTTEPEVLRSPRTGSETDRTRRAILLLALTLVVPGAAQIAAGSRRLGRVALAVTVGVWATLLLGLVLFFTLRPLLLNLLTRPVSLWTATVVLALLAVGWAILWLDTLRLIRLGSLAPGMRPIIGALTVVLLVLTSGSLGWAAHAANTSRESLGGIFSSGPSLDPVDGRYNFLLMGGDAGEGRQGLRPDSIHVVSVDADTGESLMISIPRNLQNAPFREGSPLWDVYPEGYSCGDECIINFLYTDVMQEHQDLYPDAEDPGAQAMMDAASGILDLDIQGYAMIDMGGFTELIDAMGGVEVESGGWVPYRGVRPDGSWGDTWFEPGTLELTGTEALAYARSRDFSTDYSRIQRQQCIQQAMIDQFDPQTLVTRFTEIMRAGEQVVETDLPQQQLGSFVSLAAQAKEQQPEQLVLGPPDFGELGDLFSTYPDYDAIHQRVDEILAEQDSSGDGGGLFGGASGGPPPGHPTLAAMVAAPAEGDSSAGADGSDEEDELPTQPDGSPLTREYLIEAQDAGQTAILEEAASTNDECTPAG